MSPPWLQADSPGIPPARLLIPQQATLRWPHLWLARYCTVTPAGRSLDNNSSTAFTIRRRGNGLVLVEAQRPD